MSALLQPSRRYTCRRCESKNRRNNSERYKEPICQRCVRTLSQMPYRQPLAFESTSPGLYLPKQPRQSRQDAREGVRWAFVALCACCILLGAAITLHGPAWVFIGIALLALVNSCLLAWSFRNYRF